MSTETQSVYFAPQGNERTSTHELHLKLLVTLEASLGLHSQLQDWLITGAARG